MEGYTRNTRTLAARPTRVGRVVYTALALLSLSVAAHAQPIAPPVSEAVSLAGPRFGFTMLSDGVVETLADREIAIRSPISQFGWQFEKQFYGNSGGVTAVTEWVVLVGGLEQSVPIPSLTWMVGMRTRGGAEFGIGPNITPAGAALAFAAGATFRAGPLNVPLNIAVVPSKSGLRVSVLSGFSLRRPW